MITTDATLLQLALDQQKPLAARTAERLARYVRTEFNPHSEQSWQVADKLWRAALLTRDADRLAFSVRKDPPPIPVRRFDWIATERDYDLGWPIGYGATAEDAIADLQDQFDDESEPEIECPCYACGNESTHEIKHGRAWLHVCDDPSCAGVDE